MDMKTPIDGAVASTSMGILAFGREQCTKMVHKSNSGMGVAAAGRVTGKKKPDRVRLFRKGFRL